MNNSNEISRVELNPLDFFGPIPKTVEISNKLNIREYLLPFNETKIQYFDGALRDQIMKAHNHITYIPTGTVYKINSSVLFHYTKMENFKNIISSKELWASKIGMMNDHTEIEYTRDLFINQLSNLLDNRKEKVGILKKVVKIYNEQVCKNIYSISFSKRGNLLSQWNRYAGETGVSIGFNKILLEEACAYRKSFSLIEVEYETKNQILILKKIAKELLCNYDLSLSYEDFRSSFIKNFKNKLDYLTCQFKHSGFREEEEIRLVIRNKSSNEKYFQFNYEEFYKRTGKLDLNFEYIFSSPNEKPKVKMNEIYNVLSQAKMKFLSIVDSGIPYKWS